MPEDMSGDPRVGWAEIRTDLAVERTRHAAERTLMAWIRTSISMVGFGFTMYKFFQYMVMFPNIGKHFKAQAPRNLGLALIALGTLALTAAIFEHVNFVKEVTGNARVRISLVLVVSCLMVLVGIMAFIGALAQAGPF